MSVPDTAPVLRLVRGTPTPEELAAVVTLLSALASAPGAAAPEAPVRGWNARSRQVRRPVEHGPGAWRASAWPR